MGERAVYFTVTRTLLRFLKSWILIYAYRHTNINKDTKKFILSSVDITNLRLNLVNRKSCHCLETHIYNKQEFDVVSLSSNSSQTNPIGCQAIHIEDGENTENLMFCFVENHLYLTVLRGVLSHGISSIVHICGGPFLFKRFERMPH